MSRHRATCALATLIAVVAMSAGLAACGDGGSSDKGGENPEELVEEATLQGIESGRLNLTLGVQVHGKEETRLDFNLAGAFQGEGKGQLPQLDMTATAKSNLNGKNIDFEGGLVLLPNTAYVNYEGVEYEVDPTTFGFVESALQRMQREAGAETGAEGAAACQEELGQLNLADFMENAFSEGTFDIGGTNTTEVNGDLDVSGAVDAVLEVVESPACKAQLAVAGPLPSKAEIDRAKKEVEESFVTPHVVFFIGDDNIVRDIGVQMVIYPNKNSNPNKTKGPTKIEIEFGLKLTEVNEEQTISAPHDSKPLSSLFVKLGINPIELLDVLQGKQGSESLGELLKGLGESQLR